MKISVDLEGVDRAGADMFARQMEAVAKAAFPRLDMTIRHRHSDCTAKPNGATPWAERRVVQ